MTSRLDLAEEVIVFLWILRIGFVAVIVGLAFTIMTQNVFPTREPFSVFWTTVVVALGLVIADILIPRKRIEIVSSVGVGMLVAMVLTILVSAAIEPLLFNSLNADPQQLADQQRARGAIHVLVAVALSYLCISLLLQTKDDFRFIIPYVEFAKEVKGLRPCVLDTSVLIDGRIADLIETEAIDNQLVIPRFVLAELQNIADSGDKMRRSRGRRGLDVLNRLRNNERVDLNIHDRELPEMADQPVDMKLILLARHLEAKIITGDFNLNKIARIHSVPVVNLNDISNALKPVFLPGEEFVVRVVKPGEESGQGVGYLDDGTMVVVEGARDHVSRTIRIAVTSVLQTSAGRMIFGRFLAVAGDQVRKSSSESA